MEATETMETVATPQMSRSSQAAAQAAASAKPANNGQAASSGQQQAVAPEAAPAPSSSPTGADGQGQTGQVVPKKRTSETGQGSGKGKVPKNDPLALAGKVKTRYTEASSAHIQAGFGVASLTLSRSHRFRSKPSHDPGGRASTQQVVQVHKFSFYQASRRAGGAVIGEGIPVCQQCRQCVGGSILFLSCVVQELSSFIHEPTPIAVIPWAVDPEFVFLLPCI